MSHIEPESHTHHPAAATEAAPRSSENSKFPVTPMIGVVVVLLIYFGSMFAGQLLVGIMPLFFGWSPERIQDWLTTSAYAQFAFVLVVEAITVALLVMFMRSRKLALAAVGLIKPRLRDLGIALLAYPPYFLVNAAAALAATAVFHLDIDQRQQTGFESATSTPELIATFISLVILPPLVEEFVMRGFLFSSLKQGMSVVRAAIVTSIIFAIAHLQFGSGAPLLWLAAIDTFILSLVLCYLRQKTGSLWPGIGLHMLKNCLAFAVLFILPKSLF